MQFSEIPEHNTFKNTLIKSVALDRVGHAYLFAGPIGSANLALALAFATYLNCSARTDKDACGSCFSCTKMAQFTHPDFQLLFPKKSSETATETKECAIFRNCLKENPFLTLEEWLATIEYGSGQIAKKDAHTIVQKIAIKAFTGKYKIICIWLPECLNHAAGNALLKTLEEPPAYTVFILVSFDSEKILPTIRSRSQPFYIPLFSEEGIAQLLSKKYSALTRHRCSEIAFSAAGNASKAFQWAEQTAPAHFENFSSWMRNCYSNNFTKLIKQSEYFHKLLVNEQKDFLIYALQFIRITVLSKYNPTVSYTTLADEAKFSKNFGLYITTSQLHAVINLLNQAYCHLERYANAKMLYANLSLQIAKLFKVV